VLHTVTLTWTIAGYNGNTAGNYTATGSFGLPAGVEQSAPPMDLWVTATVTVEPAAPANPTIIQIDPEGAVQNVSVAYGTTETAAEAALTPSIKIKDSNNVLHTVTLTWTIADYNGNTAGNYTATGSFGLPAGVEQSAPPMDLWVTATVTVAKPTIAAIDPEGAVQNVSVPFGTSVPDAEAAFVQSINIRDSSGALHSADLDWEINPVYNANVPGAYGAMGTFDLPTGVDQSDPPTLLEVFAVVTVETEVIPPPTIAEINPDGVVLDITVPFGTSKGDAEAALAQKIKIKDSSGVEHEVYLTWGIAGYNSSMAGNYLATGTFGLPDSVSQTVPPTALQVTATVTVEPAVVPGAIHYVALGDSLVTGTTGISGTMTTYVHGFFAHLQQVHGAGNLTMTALGSDGDTSSILLDKLNNDSTYIAEVRKADIITLIIGGNNIMPAARDSSFWSIDTALADAGTANFEAEYDAIIARINELKPGVEIIASTQYNPYNSANQPRGYTGDTALHNTGNLYIEDIINHTIRGDYGTNYHVVDAYSRFLTNYGNLGRMGNVSFFYPAYSIFWFIVRLTRDPHLNQTGQNLLRDMHIEAYNNIIYAGPQQAAA
ncbi:MAG: GDSL-type esterase/lipase family protein, partial [Eubacteriales bacterium]|nr:GDSL-type esterase/lipase family protein [Eubacteriales bacterium]